MTPEQFQRIDRVFQAVVDQPAWQREKILAAECAGDLELEREVRALLECEAQAPEVTGRVVAAAAQTLDGESDVGLRLGPYALARTIGRGGMGTVYQAVRIDGAFLHTVAVKLVHRGMDTESILQRFRTERQILTTLQRPNIAMLLDGGVAPERRPQSDPTM